MAWLTIRYSVGNEHNPGDPWGRSELVIRADDRVQYPAAQMPIVHGAAPV